MSSVTNLFPLMTLLLDIAIVIFFCMLVVRSVFTDRIVSWVGERVIFLGFLFSLGGLVGSLIYSEVIGFDPCVLCWIQRIFLYPQTILFGLALWRREKFVIPYAYTLSILGSLFALYHSFTQLGGKSFTPCTSVGGNCAKVFVLEFGYITIPMMSLSLFVAIILMCIASHRSRRLSSIV